MWISSKKKGSHPYPQGGVFQETFLSQAALFVRLLAPTEMSQTKIAKHNLPFSAVVRGPFFWGFHCVLADIFRTWPSCVFLGIYSWQEKTWAKNQRTEIAEMRAKSQLSRWNEEAWPTEAGWEQHFTIGYDGMTFNVSVGVHTGCWVLISNVKRWQVL